MFDIQLSNYDPDTPSFYVFLVTALFSFLLSGLIALTYRFTTRDLYQRHHFIQALALIGIVAATIMQAIGDSVAAGLGLIGALAIIRFRSSLNDPRNITFMFASLAAGIASGILGFYIALTGTLIFCIAAFILRFSPFHQHLELIGELRLQMPQREGQQKRIEEILAQHCLYYELDQLRFTPGKKESTVEEIPFIPQLPVETEKKLEFSYDVRLREKSGLIPLSEAIQQMEEVDSFRLSIERKTARL